MENPAHLNWSQANLVKLCVWAMFSDTGRKRSIVCLLHAVMNTESLLKPCEQTSEEDWVVLKHREGKPMHLIDK